MIIEFFYSASGARFFERLTSELERAGHEVRIINVISDQDYRATRSKLRHLWVRWLIYGWYPLKVGLYLIRTPFKPKTIRIAVTTPFYIPTLVELLSRIRQVPTICLLYDVFPDALVVAGKMHGRGFLFKILAAVTRYNIRHCSLTVYAGKHLMDYAELTYGPSKMSTILPVGSDGSAFEKQPSFIGNSDMIRILYAGTMGHMHDTETISRVLTSILPRNVEFAFHSSGVKYKQLQNCVLSRFKDDKRQVAFSGPLLDTAWRLAMEEAHIAIVTMAPGSENVIFPSKTYSALMAGQAILGICPKRSDLATLIQTYDCGWVIEPGDVKGLRSTLFDIAEDRTRVDAKRKNAYSAGHRYFDMSTVARQMIAKAEVLLNE
jgi:glycosyltransferase involved in cell wall biosynthesis